MSALSKVQASLVSGTQETTLALANLNFDFSLVKVEAPAEYRQLGLALAKKRRSAAENGIAHITARRLGSLFQSILPDTPKLMKAYGLRASEIAQSPEANPKGSKDYGPFQDYIGVDGTTIWAAATSSPAAIAAHLLACMLATHWPADKAIAIWVELVNERKKRLEETSNSDSFRLADAAASQMSLDQEQLAMWDASARAWLKAAEDAPVVKSRQKNLRSVLIDVDATVSGRQDLYTSVTEAWLLALSTFEAIIGGASYSISDGAVILALLSWHLYPDIVTLATKPQNILQKDDLVSGGQVTIGLASQDQSLGVHWCLSLGHLSYYGASQRVTQSIDAQHNRLTLLDFTLVLLGGFVGLWSSEEHIDTCQALEIINLAISIVKEGLDAQGDRFANAETNTIFIHFADAISRYRTHNLVHDGSTTKLVDLGVRYKDFFNPGIISRPNPCFRLFGMNDLYFGYAFAQQNDRLAYCRSIIPKLLTKSAHSLDTTPCFLLVFKHSDDKDKKAFFYWRHVAEDFSTVARENRVELKSFKLCKPGLSLRNRTPPLPSLLSLLWAHPPVSIKAVLARSDVIRVEREEKNEAGHGWIFDCVFRSADEEFLLFRTRNLQVLPKELGYSESLAEITIPQHSIQDVITYLRSGKLCPIRFSNLFCTTSFYCTYLARLSSLFRTYQGLSGATISPDILKCTGRFWYILSASGAVVLPPGSLKHATLVIPPEAAEESSPREWPGSTRPQFESEAPPQDKLLFGSLNKRRLMQIFNLIASFETGQDLHLQLTSLITNVFAISVDDSLYIASPLLSDPASGFGGPLEIRRVRGNIGRPGLNLLGFFAPHDAIRMREKEPGMWKLINHHEFDGRLEDCFSSTTLHLRLTGYVHEVALQGGLRFSSVSFTEAVVSSHDAGNWVADLDLLNDELINRLILITARKECPGSREVGKSPGKQLLTIENWEELLDPPRAPAVFKAHGNWQARLAAVFVCLRNGYHTLLFGSHGCWDCAFGHLSKVEPDAELTLIRSKSPAPGPPGQEELALSRSTFQGTDIPGEDRDISSPEPLKEDSSSTLDDPDSAGLDELSIGPLGQSGNNGDSQVIDATATLSQGTTPAEVGNEKGVDILHEESSEESSEESKPVHVSHGSKGKGRRGPASHQGGKTEGEWPRDSGPQPIVFIQ